MVELPVESFNKASSAINRVIEEVLRVYVGKREIVRLSVAALFAERHLLIEGFPGTGKTLLAKALAKTVGGTYSRVQGHPDILPSDILGFHIYRLGGERVLVKGPIFTNILLFDELNRTPTRSQSALLEPMQEFQVTIDGVTYKLEKPFMVIATQIPREHATGVYQVIETLLDRFAVVVESYYNPPEEEIEILEKSDLITSLPINQVISLDYITEISSNVQNLVYADRSIVEYVVRLINYVRHHTAVAYGPSHRVTVDVLRLSRVLALMDGRDYVIPDDIKNVFPYAVTHRFRLKEEFELEGISRSAIVREALNNVPVPK